MAASLAFGGHSNGRIPAAALISVGRGFLLERTAALQFLAARAFILLARGIDILDYVSETYRDWDGQVFQRERWTRLGKPNNAAVPGNSIHGWAKAIDFNADALMAAGIYDYVMGVLEQFGFIRDVVGESWHVSFREAQVTTWADSSITEFETPEQREERELMSALEEIKAEIAASEKRILERTGRGGLAVYWHPGWGRTYSVSPGLIHHHSDTVQRDLGYQQAGQLEEHAIPTDDFNIIRLFSNNGVDLSLEQIRKAPAGTTFTPGMKVTW